MLTLPSLLSATRPVSAARVIADVNRLFEQGGSAQWPQIGLWANSEEAVVRAELPGFSAETIEVEVKDRALKLSGERKVEGESEYVRKERFSGRFDRSVRLPFAVDAEKVKARFTDGVLEVKLPRIEADKPRKIAIGK